jgi:tRNA 2-thiouridine synthesizing protein E
MSTIKLIMKQTKEPLKRFAVTVLPDNTDNELTALTDRNGIAHLPNAKGSGRVLIDGNTQYQGNLEKHILIEMWSLSGGQSAVDAGAPAGIDGGSMAYTSMQTRTIVVNGREILTDSEGYLVYLEDWSEAVVYALADSENLTLTDEHWQIIRYLRSYYNDYHVQVTVRDMIKYFRKEWGRERGNNRYLHELFPNGGPQKQGNRLAGLLRTKGEH